MVPHSLFPLNNRNKNQIFILSPVFQHPDECSYPPVLWTGGCELLRQDHQHSHQADQQGVRLPLLLCPLWLPCQPAEEDSSSQELSCPGPNISRPWDISPSASAGHTGALSAHLYGSYQVIAFATYSHRQRSMFNQNFAHYYWNTTYSWTVFT